jgi:CxxC motif-containing protein
MICITCPIGCRLEVEQKEGETVSVSGNKCPKGIVYATEEMLAPKRTVTATCATNSREYPRIPVKSLEPFPKEHIKDLLEKLYDLEIELPIKRGEVILTGISGVDIPVVVTMSLE